MSALFAFAHHLAAFAFVACLVLERVLLGELATPAQARRLIRVDAVYGLAALSVLALGLARVFLFEKGAAYYLHNAAFLAKAGLFLAIGLLSIRPTLRFLGWRAALREDRLPPIDAAQLAGLRRLVTLELALLVPLLLCAALMARGHLQLG